MKGGGLAQTLQVQAVQLPLHSVNIHTAAKPRGRGDSALGEGPGGGMVASAAFVLFEGASGYALFEVTALDELALGAAPVQQWKQTLREDFARDDDNYSSGAADANLDVLRKAMGGTDFFSDIE